MDRLRFERLFGLLVAAVVVEAQLGLHLGRYLPRAAVDPLLALHDERGRLGLGTAGVYCAINGRSHVAPRSRHLRDCLLAFQPLPLGLRVQLAHNVALEEDADQREGVGYPLAEGLERGGVALGLRFALGLLREFAGEFFVEPGLEVHRQHHLLALAEVVVHLPAGFDDFALGALAQDQLHFDFLALDAAADLFDAQERQKLPQAVLFAAEFAQVEGGLIRKQTALAADRLLIGVLAA